VGSKDENGQKSWKSQRQITEDVGSEFGRARSEEPEGILDGMNYYRSGDSGSPTVIKHSDRSGERDLD
jgi:hypothetical protein